MYFESRIKTVCLIDVISPESVSNLKHQTQYEHIVQIVESSN